MTDKILYWQEVGEAHVQQWTGADDDKILYYRNTL
jgi:hypothetical protein